ncbi:MAG: hypothetical protein L6Q57_04605 [Alphaproteobacteria bacterium]|nr:hypothetical protein [Alphaproteobacteria bacterium]
MDRPSMPGIILVIIALLGFCPVRANAQDTSACAAQDRPCLLNQLQEQAALIDNVEWRDQTYRELAKTRAFDGDVSGAIAIIPLISSPDTKALTIRGIGMAAAENRMAPEVLSTVFSSLLEQARAITHEPSRAIALTYIAMAQAFAGDDAGAWATAEDMENEALRHKAYGETAEIQAEHGRATAAMESLNRITSEAYKIKALTTVSGILAQKGDYNSAYTLAAAIANPYRKALALQVILDVQKPRAVEK